jgi:hypothetical protein
VCSFAFISQPAGGWWNSFLSTFIEMNSGPNEHRCSQKRELTHQSAKRTPLRLGRSQSTCEVINIHAFFLPFYFMAVLSWGTLWHSQKFLQYNMPTLSFFVDTPASLGLPSVCFLCSSRYMGLHVCLSWINAPKGSFTLGLQGWFFLLLKNMPY